MSRWAGQTGRWATRALVGGRGPGPSGDRGGWRRPSRRTSRRATVSWCTNDAPARRGRGDGAVAVDSSKGRRRGGGIRRSLGVAPPPWSAARNDHPHTGPAPLGESSVAPDPDRATAVGHGDEAERPAPEGKRRCAGARSRSRFDAQVAPPHGGGGDAVVTQARGGGARPRASATPVGLADGDTSGSPRTAAGPRRRGPTPTNRRGRGAGGGPGTAGCRPAGGGAPGLRGGRRPEGDQLARRRRRSPPRRQGAAGGR